MKYALFAALSLVSVMASAQEPEQPAALQPVVEQYSYAQNLDVAKVLSIDTAESNLCEPVVASMVYLDSQGVEHELHYTRLSETCSSHG